MSSPPCHSSTPPRRCRSVPRSHAGSSWVPISRPRPGWSRRIACCCAAAALSWKTKSPNCRSGSSSWLRKTGSGWARSVSSPLDRRGHRVLGRVRGVDLVLVMLLDHAALDLERRGQLSRLDREVILEQQDFLGRLELGEIAQRAHHFALHLRLHIRQPDQLGARPVHETTLLRPALEVLEVRDDENDGELAAVAV